MNPHKSDMCLGDILEAVFYEFADLAKLEEPSAVQPASLKIKSAHTKEGGPNRERLAIGFMGGSLKPDGACESFLYLFAYPITGGKLAPESDAFRSEPMMTMCYSVNEDDPRAPASLEVTYRLGGTVPVVAWDRTVWRHELALRIQSRAAALASAALRSEPLRQLLNAEPISA